MNQKFSPRAVWRSMPAPLRVAALSLLSLFLVLRFSPYPALKAFRAMPYSARYYDRSGELVQITALEGGMRREYLPLAEIPREVQDVFTAAEDRRFYLHWGIDPAALARAAVQNAQSRRTVSGASTITMQLARIIREQTERPPAGRIRRLARKTGEAVDALRLEARLSKKQVLELYLNSLPFGASSCGVASASLAFFAKDLHELSSAEILLLAVIPRRPALYNPLTHPAEAAAAAEILREHITGAGSLARRYPAIAALDAEGITRAAQTARRFRYPFRMPHYVRLVDSRQWTVDSIRSGSKRGTNADNTVNTDIPDKKLPTTHYSLPTTPPRTTHYPLPTTHYSLPTTPYPLPPTTLAASLKLQNLAEKLIYGNVQRYKASRLSNGAALVMDNRTGEILCWVGSADYNDDAGAGQIDGVLALNQPGSSMKPFLYALALERGFLPTDILADIPKTYGERELYIPQNFNNRFNGPVLFRAALASSLNIPAVELLNRLSVKNYTALLYELGFESVRASAENAGLGLALGNAPVSLLELVRAFSVFPNDGRLVELSPFCENAAALPHSTVIYDKDIARIICSMLSDKSARVLAFGMVTNFNTPFPSMFKTGTANQYQSIVALGATPRYTAGVWMGNFTGETVIGRTGSSVPARIVRELLEFLEAGQPPADFAAPEGWELAPVCALSGMPPGPYCVSTIQEWVRRGASLPPAESEFSAKTPDLDNTRHPWRASLPQSESEFSTKTPDLNNTRHPWRAAGMPPVSKDDSSAQAELYKQIAHGSAICDCDMHTPAGIIYPAEYQAWFLAAQRNGELDYASAPLEIISPRDGFVFFASTEFPQGKNAAPGGSPAARPSIPVEVIGGAADTLTVEYDGKPLPSASRPFVFFLPQERGEHRLAIRCGNEESAVRFSVE